jgi:hypothetical protein
MPMRIVDFAEMLQGSINDKIKQSRGDIHESHNPIYNKSLEVEIDALQWVQGQIQHLVINNERKDKIWADLLLASWIGWLLDVHIENDYAILWIKTEEDGQILKLRDSYHPGFYILPRNEADGLHLFQILSREEEIAVRWEEDKHQIFLIVGKQENWSMCSNDR